MRHNGRILSAAVLASATVLLMGITVYHAKADDVNTGTSGSNSQTSQTSAQTSSGENSNSGTSGTSGTSSAGGSTNTNTNGTGTLIGYVDGEADEVSNLSIKSLGTFNYSTGGNGRDILIASSDLKDLESATKALSTQLLFLGDATKIADDAAKAETDAKLAVVNQKISANAESGNAAVTQLRTDMNTELATVNQAITNSTESNNTAITNLRTDMGTEFGRVDRVIGSLDNVVYEYVNEPGNPTITFSPSANHTQASTGGSTSGSTSGGTSGG